MSNITMKFDGRAVDKFLVAIAKKTPQALDKAVKNTALYAKRKTGTDVRRRTGNLARSYKIDKKTLAEYKVDTDVFYADYVEDRYDTISGSITPNVEKRLEREVNVAIGRMLKGG